jgi:uncharacterized protein YrrD
MLRSLKDLENLAIGATDGPIGQVKDFFFDDGSWVVRYLVVETGTWLSSRMVLISPMSVLQPVWAERLLPVSITKEQVRNSPDIDSAKPVSRQHEIELHGYYGYPVYWGGIGLWGEGLYPYAMLPDDPRYGADRAGREREYEDEARAQRARQRSDDPHLRSCRAITGYRIHATDGEIGHVDGLLVDPETWSIRHLIVNTSNWWVGHQVLVAPRWVSGLHWDDQSVSVDLTRAAVKEGRTYESVMDLSSAPV